MEKLLSISEIVEKASKRGVDFGKGDPYNRLRYYTKLGWLPHMTRKGVDGKMIGHYPASSLETLITIENLKSEGLSNEEISERLSVAKTTKTSVFAKRIIKISGAKKHLKNLLIVILVFGILVSLGIIPLEKDRGDFVKKTLENRQSVFIDNGVSYMPKGQKEVFITTKNVKTTSSVNVTFSSDYSPANRFWVSQIVPFEGFYLSVDTQVNNDSEFRWWVSD